MRLIDLFGIIVGVVAASELVLNDLHLLAQIIIALTACDVVAHLAVYILLALKQLALAVEYAYELEYTCKRFILVEHLLLVCVFHKNGGSDEVGKQTGGCHTVGGKLDVGGDIGHKANDLIEDIERFAHIRLALYAAVVGDLHRARKRIGVDQLACLAVFGDRCAGKSLADYSDTARRFCRLAQACHGAGPVKICGLYLAVCRDLCADDKAKPVCGICGVYCGTAAFVADLKAYRNAGKSDSLAQREHREGQLFGFFYVF